MFMPTMPCCLFHDSCLTTRKNTGQQDTDVHFSVHFLPISVGFSERCAEFFCWSPSLYQGVYGYSMGLTQEGVPASIRVAGLAYQCLPQWMMAGNEVVVPCVQPAQVFDLRDLSGLLHIASLAGQH